MATCTKITGAVALDLRDIATDIVARSIKAGATEAETVIREGAASSTVVRLGEVETLEDAASRELSLRVFVGQRAAIAYSNDFTSEGIDRLINDALGLAHLMSEDPFAGLPEPSQFGALAGDLQLYCEDVRSLPPGDRICYARRAEQASLEGDHRLKNSIGGVFNTFAGRTVLANSRGFAGESRSSNCMISAAPIAQGDDGSMQSDYWFSSARSLRKLESSESIGKEAARRTLRKLGARSVASTRVPVVFDPMVAGSILRNICDAVNGAAIYRQGSFLAGRLGQKVASTNVTVVDDGTIPGGFGTSPFDGEGIPTQRTVVIENGVLKSYLLNTYVARKLNLSTTGNASRGRAGNPGIGASNFFLKAGAQTPQQIISAIKNGFYVTEFLGFGANLVTGNFSRGAAGLWIENGELAFPVEEVTVAGNLKDMINNISEIGNDFEFRSSTACPTLRVDGMTIAGA